MIIKQIRASNPELHEIRSGGKIIGHVEIGWAYCKAYFGKELSYVAHDWRFWNGFNNSAQRSYHLGKIKSLVENTGKKLLAISKNDILTSPHVGGEV